MYLILLNQRFLDVPKQVGTVNSTNTNDKDINVESIKRKMSTEKETNVFLESMKSQLSKVRGKNKKKLKTNRHKGEF